MRNAIIEKLNRHLTEGIIREADVVYLLVEIRKLLDHGRPSLHHRYPQLRFYADWVVHTELSRISRGSALYEYLKRINDAVAVYIQKNNEQDMLKKITNAISLDRIKDEMTTFFQEGGLDGHLLEVAQWRNFIKLLISILTDSPLLAPNKPDFNLVEQFSFKLNAKSTHVAGFEILCRDGSTLPGGVLVR